MTPREAFKAGFLLRCAEEGLDEAQTMKRAEAGLAGLAKQALGPGVGVGTVLDILTKAPGALMGAGQMAALPFAIGGTAGLVGGGLAGHYAAKAMDPGYDHDDLKRQELIEAYNQSADDVTARQDS